jgi:hypothetical protein
MNKILTLIIVLLLASSALAITTSQETASVSRLVGETPQDLINQLDTIEIDLNHAQYYGQQPFLSSDTFDEKEDMLQTIFNNNQESTSDWNYNSLDIEDFITPNNAHSLFIIEADGEVTQNSIKSTQDNTQLTPSQTNQWRDDFSHNYPLFLLDSDYAGLTIPRQESFVTPLSRYSPIVAPTFVNSPEFVRAFLCNIGNGQTIGHSFREARNRYFAYTNPSEDELIGITLMSYHLYSNPLTLINPTFDRDRLNNYCNDGKLIGEEENLNFNVADHDDFDFHLNLEVGDFGQFEQDDYLWITNVDGQLDTQNGYIEPIFLISREIPKDAIITDFSYEFGEAVVGDENSGINFPNLENDELVDRFCYKNEIEPSVDIKTTLLENKKVILLTVRPLEFTNCEQGIINLYMQFSYNLDYVSPSKVEFDELNYNPIVAPNKNQNIIVDLNYLQNQLNGELELFEKETLIYQRSLEDRPNQLTIPITSSNQETFTKYKLIYKEEDQILGEKTFDIETKLLDYSVTTNYDHQNNQAQYTLNVINRDQDQEVTMKVSLIHDNQVLQESTQEITFESGNNQVSNQIQIDENLQIEYDLRFDITYNNKHKVINEVVITNHKPILEPIAPITKKIGEVITIEPRATDQENEQIQITISDPIGNDGEWDTSNDQPDVYEITITASDGQLQDTLILPITLVENNLPILEEIADIQIQAGEIANIFAFATDEDDDQLVYSINNDNFEQNEQGWFVWETNDLDFGEYQLEVSVSDGLNHATREFTLNIIQIFEDGDEDGANDDVDNCPVDPNPLQEDLDEDGEGDVCDEDKDGDNIEDIEDNCPLDSNPNQEDNNNDGVGDECSVDDDEDNVINENDNCPNAPNPNQEDLNNNGVGDACDDTDNDQINDDQDNCPLIPNPDQPDVDRDGIGDECDDDEDNDNVINVLDNCRFVENQNQEDLDEDGIGDHCDNDKDGDAIENEQDNCPLIANPDQLDTDNDGIGDECDDDEDNDNVINELDNCPQDPNPLQEDLDDDGRGDECDSDIDGDGESNRQDNCPLFAPNLEPRCHINNFEDQDNLDSLVPVNGIWEVQDGSLHQQSERGSWKIAYANIAPRQDSKINVDVYFEERGADKIAVLFRYDAQRDEGYAVTLTPSGNDMIIVLEDFKGSEYSRSIRNAEPGWQYGSWFPLEITSDEMEIIVTFNGERLTQAFIGKHTNGLVALGTYRGQASFDNFHICPTGQEDLDEDGQGDVCDGDIDGDTIENEQDNCPINSNENQLDTDNDDQGNICDIDMDNDNVLNENDNCPRNANPDQEDLDEDNRGDICDSDIDGDVRNNEQDNCPLIRNLDQEDIDNDGVGDVCDEDMDGDNVVNNVDNCRTDHNPNQENSDDDLSGDACDSDIDGDTIANNNDNCPQISNQNQANLDDDEEGDACDNDIDGDNVINNLDNCKNDPNEDQANLDEDKFGDACDLDIDGDLIRNNRDNCPAVRNGNQANLDNDELGDACDNDIDGDNVNNEQDNCPQNQNQDQANLDNDAEGDICDNDIDNDNVNNEQDNCLQDHNEDQANLDNDAEGDACDNDIDGDTIANNNDNCQTIPNPNQEDLDNDNAGDACDDSDADGLLDEIDNCPLIENQDQANLDNDEEGDVCDNDIDGDTIANNDDNCQTTPNEDQSNLDNDNAGDACDDDDDNDRVNDNEDNCPQNSNPNQEDFNDDQEGDVCDDTDNDRVMDDIDNCQLMFNRDQEDLDADNIGNVCDRDRDGDNILNINDNCINIENPNQENLDNDNEGDVCDWDIDGDFQRNEEDNCPINNNRDQEDRDNDNQGDVCDEDIDGDSVLNENDNCPNSINPNQENLDNDELGDICDNDRENDGILNVNDNCQYIENNDQSDIDNDNRGDACDNDMDNDNVLNNIDNCPLIQNPNQENIDGDDLGDICDDIDDRVDEHVENIEEDPIEDPIDLIEDPVEEFICNNQDCLPDLSIVSIQLINPQEVIESNLAIYEIVIENIGDQNQRHVTWTITNENSGEIILSENPIYEIRSNSIYSLVVKIPTLCENLIFTIDSKDNINERDENNNIMGISNEQICPEQQLECNQDNECNEIARCINHECLPVAELFIENIRLTNPQDTINGQTAIYDFEIHNLGQITANNVNWKVINKVTNEELFRNEHPINSIDPNSFYNDYAKINNQCVDLRFIVDFDNEIPELKETNNFKDHNDNDICNLDPLIINDPSLRQNSNPLLNENLSNNNVRRGFRIVPKDNPLENPIIKRQKTSKKKTKTKNDPLKHFRYRFG